MTRHQGGRSVTVGSDVFEVLAEEVASGPLDARWFGYFGYASRPDLPARASIDLPDAVWMRPSHVELIPAPPADSSRTPPTRHERLRLVTNDELCHPDVYQAAFEAVQEHLHAGDSYEVNLTYRAHAESPDDPIAVYSRLRRWNAAPYAGLLKHEVPDAAAWLLSSSPECYVRVDVRDDSATFVTSRPIKGTTPRGTTPEQDAELAEQLRTDPRFGSEHLMIVDLLRNDLATVCRPGTVEVPSFQAVEPHPAVHQLVSTVVGRLREGLTTVDAVRALFPPGSMTGAPKLRTMRIIDDVEWSPRGAYSGAFGYLEASGAADLGVVIRSLTTTGDGHWSVGTGGGITVYSPLDEELAESRWKASRVLAALTSSRGR